MDFGLAWEKIHTMGRGFIRLLPNIALGIICFLVILFAGKLVSKFVRGLAHRGSHGANLSIVLSRITMAFFVIFGILIFCAIVFPSVKPADIISLLGVGGVAIGFAFKDIFQNMLAGIIILATEPFQIGDQLVIGNFEGKILDIQVRATIMKTTDNRRVVIPNSDIFMSKIMVNSDNDLRKGTFVVPIGLNEDVKKAKGIIIDEIKKIPDVKADPSPTVLVKEIGNFSINLEIGFWVQPPTTRSASVVTDDALILIRQKLDEAKIEVPFPTYEVFLKDGHGHREPIMGDGNNPTADGQKIDKNVDSVQISET